MENKTPLALVLIVGVFAVFSRPRGDYLSLPRARGDAQRAWRMDTTLPVLSCS